LISAFGLGLSELGAAAEAGSSYHAFMDAPCPNCERLQRRVAELEAQVARLTALVEQLQRAAKRQAAPFAKKPPKANPQPPGRKPGADYGTPAQRPAPPPEQIDEVHEAPLPDACPDCDGPVDETHTAQQYQVEIPRRPLVRQFTVHVGQCRNCHRRVQGRHPLQTSDALGAAASQLGPQTQAALALLNKELGLSHGKVVRCLEQLFGIRLSRSGSVHTVLRVGRRCQPAYQALRRAVRDSPWVVPDETGWRVAGRNAWLHVLVGPQATCYVIDPTRSGAVAEDLLGADYAGTLIHDGWSVYDRFRQAVHQQCLQHLLKRCRELLMVATRGAVRFPRAVAALLRQALRLRDRFAVGAVSRHGLAVACGRLHGRLLDLAWPRKQHAANERLAQFLWDQQAHLLTFLQEPGLDATNWRAEQALRPAVVNRKVWGGNRTWRGAEAQAVLTSVLRTCWQQGRDALDFLSRTLCALQAPKLLLAS
jgi:transposase